MAVGRVEGFRADLQAVNRHSMEALLPMAEVAAGLVLMDIQGMALQEVEALEELHLEAIQTKPDFLALTALINTEVLAELHIKEAAQAERAAILALAAAEWVAVAAAVAAAVAQ